MLTVEAIGADFQARLGAPAPEPSKAARTAIDQIWDAEKAKRGDALFNGSIFSVSTVSRHGVSGFMTEYKRYVAQRREPALFSEVRVRPLSISGYLECDDGMILGRRSHDVEQFPGAWEFAPSGVIDGSAIREDGSADIEGCLLTELVEETGIARADVARGLKPVITVEDTDDRSIDVVFSGRVSLGSASVHSAFGRRTTREYLDIAIVPAANILTAQTPLTAVSPITHVIAKAMEAKP